MAKYSYSFTSRYSLTETEVDRVIAKAKIGAYVLGTAADSGGIYVKYVGRSDSDLNARLKQHVGANSEYTHFQCVYGTTALEAFNTECKLYHDYPNKNNKIHPDKPKGQTPDCPVDDCTNT